MHSVHLTPCERDPLPKTGMLGIGLLSTARFLCIKSVYMCDGVFAEMGEKYTGSDIFKKKTLGGEYLGENQ